jgi:hypothetical protein
MLFYKKIKMLIYSSLGSRLHNKLILMTNELYIQSLIRFLLFFGPSFFTVLFIAFAFFSLDRLFVLFTSFFKLNLKLLEIFFWSEFGTKLLRLRLFISNVVCCPSPCIVAGLHFLQGAKQVCRLKQVINYTFMSFLSSD